jgi:hypothetical protein
LAIDGRKWTTENSPAALSPGRNPAFITQEAEKAPEPVWAFWRRDESPAPTGTPNPDLPACCLAKTLRYLVS